MNTGEPLVWPDPYTAEQRVLRMQAKLHLWAAKDPGRRFDDLFNLVYHPDFLTVAWERVRGNKGARTAGVDRVIPAFISDDADIVAFLDKTRQQLKSRTFTPLPVRERLIPKGGQPGKYRRLGIPSAMDRLVQASLVLVLEPIFEADFKPVSYGFRPRRRAQDAIAEIHYFGSRGYHWVFEADITACFDELSHCAILERVRRRIGDKRVLALIKAFLKAGIMSEAGEIRDTTTGTPQGGLCSAEHKPPKGSPLKRSRRARAARCCGRGSRLPQELVATPVRWRARSRLMSSAGLCAALSWRAWWGPVRRASAAHNPSLMRWLTGWRAS